MGRTCIYLLVTVSLMVPAVAGQPVASPLGELRPPAAFAGIADERARAAALFEEAGKVLTHPRCVNCHQSSDRPRQTDARLPHQPPVVGGDDGLGPPGMRCGTCHGASNFDPARVPGDAHWRLVFPWMGWEGRSPGQICEQIKDPERNGWRSIAAILDHVTTDSLVMWAWSPGRPRTPAPGSHAEFTALLRAWAAAGAHCPAS